MSEVNASVEQVKAELAACEKEIGSLRAQLRSLGPADENAPKGGKLVVAWLKTEGLPEAAQPALSLQLSSPIEELELKTVYDEADESTAATFEAADLPLATLTVSAKDADIPLGSSIAYDLSTTLNSTGDGPATSELPVAILPAKEGDDDTAVVAEAVCTVTLRLSYEPSVKEKKAKLYEELNGLTRKKAGIMDKLRTLALAASRQSGPRKPTSPAVSAGFLNRPRPDDKPKGVLGKLVNFFNRTLGPNSMVQMIFPVVKNYIIFFGVVGFFHYQGQQLALPPPV